MTRAGVEIVVVEVQPRGFEALGLAGVEHAEGHACLQPELLHPPDHLQYAIEVGAVLHGSPRGSHAEAVGALCACCLRCLHDFVDVGQRAALHCFVVHALRAVSAVFRATTGLDAEQLGALDCTGGVVLPVNLSCLEDQIEQRALEQGEDLVGGGPGGRRSGGHGAEF